MAAEVCADTDGPQLAADVVAVVKVLKGAVPAGHHIVELGNGGQFAAAIEPEPGLLPDPPPAGSGRCWYWPA
jgi:hypothetical protein